MSLSLIQIANLAENPNARKRMRIAMLGAAQIVLGEAIAEDATESQRKAHARRQKLAFAMGQYPDHYAERVLMKALTSPAVAEIAGQLDADAGILTAEDELAMDNIIKAAAVGAFDQLVLLVPEQL